MIKITVLICIKCKVTLLTYTYLPPHPLYHTASQLCLLASFLVQHFSTVVVMISLVQLCWISLEHQDPADSTSPSTPLGTCVGPITPPLLQPLPLEVKQLPDLVLYPIPAWVGACYEEEWNFKHYFKLTTVNLSVPFCTFLHGVAKMHYISITS